MKLYLAGPMTGLPDYNLPTFARVTAELEAAGYEVNNPGRHGVIDGYTWADYLRRGIKELLDCDGLALMNCWDTSEGAKLEAYVARKIGMPIHRDHVWLTMPVATP